MSFHPAEDNGEFRNHFYHEFGKESYTKKSLAQQVKILPSLVINASKP